MRVLILLAALSLALLVISPSGALAKKTKKTKGKGKSEGKMFDTKVLQCLVCQNLVDEFHAAVRKVDPKKVIDTGTFRIDGNGEQKRSIVPFARSQVHLMELVDKVCDNFEDYAQAKFKSTGAATIIRLTTPDGNMNPKFGEVDIVPDEELNTKLKFHCQSIVEANEEDFTTLLADPSMDAKLKQEVCVKRSKLCSSLQRDEL